MRAAVVTFLLLGSVFHLGYSRPPLGRKVHGKETKNDVFRDLRQVLSTTLTDETGVITSPNYPYNYDNDGHHTWTIKVASGKYVELQSEAFDIEAESACSYDVLEVHSGLATDSDSLIARFCGTSGPNLVVANNIVTLVFISDVSVVEPGFKISYLQVEETEDAVTPVICSANPVEVPLEGDSGTLVSPGYPSSYANSLNCAWTLVVPSDKIVKLEFRDFQIEAGCSGGCNYDHVALHNGDNLLNAPTGIFCGSNPPTDVFSTSNKLTVHFKTDSSVVKRGFQAIFTAVDEEEGGSKEPDACIAGQRPEILDETLGVLASPVLQTSSSYPHNQLCEWLITVPQGMYAHVHFESFALEAGSQCPYDHVELFDGDSSSATSMGKTCGYNTPGDVTASSNSMFVRFKSDSSVANTGFTATYSAREMPNGGGGSGSGSGDSGEGGSGTGGGNDDILCGIQDIEPQNARIVGGEEARPHSWPWQISMRWGDFHFCGGSVISRKWIVTAAHCVTDQPGSVSSPSSIQILTGAHQKNFYATDEPSRQLMSIARIIPHEEYFLNGKDIALIELTEELDFTAEVHPICMPRVAVADDLMCLTTGWGNTENTGDSSFLQQVRVPIISQATCSRPDYYGSSINEFMVCAGYEMGGMDSCQGDSGGPLMCGTSHYTLHGITSWGYGCADARAPGVYTRVSTVVDWVHQHTQGSYYLEP